MDSRPVRQGREAAAKDLGKALAKEKAKATKASAPVSRRMVHRRAARDGAAAEPDHAPRHVLPRTRR
jgi:hypothetical protein